MDGDSQARRGIPQGKMPCAAAPKSAAAIAISTTAAISAVSYGE
jgi:hypothetical protein